MSAASGSPGTVPGSGPVTVARATGVLAGSAAAGPPVAARARSNRAPRVSRTEACTAMDVTLAVAAPAGIGGIAGVRREPAATRPAATLFNAAALSAAVALFGVVLLTRQPAEVAS